MHRLASAVVKGSRPFSVRNRIWDLLAILAIAFAVWKIFVAPRSFDGPHAHPAPHAVLARLGGGTFRLADQRGRVVFLDFYATWCEPCRLELPLVERWSRAHPSAVVIPVDVGERVAAVRRFARRYDLRGVTLADSTTAGALFGVAGLPTIVVVDDRGFLRAKWEGLNPAISLAMTNALRSLRRAAS